MTTTSHNRETLALVAVIEKGNLMKTNGTAKSGRYAIRDYSRKATKDKTPIRWITQYAKPENLSAWLIENMGNGAMARTVNGATYYEIGHALAVWDSTIFSDDNLKYPLMPRGTARKYVASQNMKQASQNDYDGYPTEYFGRSI